MLGAVAVRCREDNTALNEAGQTPVARQPSPSSCPGGRTGSGTRGQRSAATSCFVREALRYLLETFGTTAGSFSYELVFWGEFTPPGLGPQGANLRPTATRTGRGVAEGD